LDAEFVAAGVAYEPPRTLGFAATNTGRLVLSVVRIVCEHDDYVAHRVLLGLRSGVGIGICCRVADAVIASNLNYRDIFYGNLPAGVFTGRALTALTNARNVCGTLLGWQSADTVIQRNTDISAIVTAAIGAAHAQTWLTFATSLPNGMTLEELRDFLWADTDEQQATLLKAVLARLQLPIPPEGVLPPRVRVMTMHGAKGLGAKVVFIPGLEEDILPGPWRIPYPGLVLEAARLLYVSITRARIACILSYAQSRIVHGAFGHQVPSRFAASLGAPFVARVSGLSPHEAAQVFAEANFLCPVYGWGQSRNC
jgi:superfamily I DNA/RNA helicase